MLSLLRAIQPIQRIFIPFLLGFAAFLLYRLFIKKDKAAGLALYIGLVVIVDGYMEKGLFIPGLEAGSIKFSEMVWLVLFFQDKELRKKINYAFLKKYKTLIWLYVFFMFIAIFMTPSMKEGLFYFRAIFLPQMLAFTIAITGLRERGDYIRFFQYLIILFVFSTIYIIWLRFFDITIIHSVSMYSQTFAHNVSIGRHGSFWGNPNYLAAVIVLITPVYTMLVLEKGKYRYIYFFTLLFLVFMLSQTGSRSALVFFVFSISLLCILIKFKKTVKLLALALVAAVIFSVVMPGVIQTMTRRFDVTEVRDEMNAEEFSGRGFLWYITLHMIKKHPFGIGLGENNFFNKTQDYMARNGHSLNLENFSLDNPHNSYLEITTMGGIQSLVIFIIILVSFLNIARKVIGKKNQELLTGITVGLIGFMGAMMNEPIMFKVAVANLFWINLGLGISLINIAFRDRENHS